MSTFAKHFNITSNSSCMDISAYGSFEAISAKLTLVQKTLIALSGMLPMIYIASSHA